MSHSEFYVTGFRIQTDYSSGLFLCRGPTFSFAVLVADRKTEAWCFMHEKLCTVLVREVVFNQAI